MTDQTPEAAALDTLRSYLQSGATISATDPNGRILELQPDGVWYGGLDLVFPPGVEATTAFDELRYPRAENEELQAENERLAARVAELEKVLRFIYSVAVDLDTTAALACLNIGDAAIAALAAAENKP